MKIVQNIQNRPVVFVVVDIVVGFAAVVASCTTDCAIGRQSLIASFHRHTRPCPIVVASATTTDCICQHFASA